MAGDSVRPRRESIAMHVLCLAILAARVAGDGLFGGDRPRLRSTVVPAMLDDPQGALKELGGVPEFNWDNLTDPSVLFHEISQNTLSLEFRNRIYQDPINVLNPTCGIMAIATVTGVACPAVRTLEAHFAKAPPELQRFFQMQIHPSAATNRVLPVPLAVYDGPLPAIVDRAVGEAERHTYWWYFSAINKAWEWMGQQISLNVTDLPRFPDLPIVDGWETGALMSALTGPLAITIHRGDHLVILVRGSQVPQDWATNFNYTLSRPVAEALHVPGRVHTGFGVYAVQLAPQVDSEIERVAPERITVTGDSLGGAVANLLGAYIAGRHGHRLTGKVEVVGIASPRVGDHEFSGFYREHVNGRTPSFLGEGLRLRPQPTFEIGDVVVQVPWSCFALPECHFRTRAEYLYEHHGGMVLITPPMLINAESWEKEANWVDPAIGSNGIVTTHMCAYWCYFTTGTQEAHGNMCYFPRDPAREGGSPYDFCAYGSDLPPPSVPPPYLTASEKVEAAEEAGAGGLA